MNSPSPSQQKTDSELVELAKRDPEFFGILMERYESPLLRYIRRISFFSSEDAEDILQETFIKAYRNLNDYDPDAKFSSWIYRIAHNQTIDTIRKRKIDIASVSIEEDDLSRFLQSTINIERETIQRECLKKITRVIYALPETYRDALILRFLEEKSYEEIMDILHIPKGSVATLINRGRKILRNRMKEENIDCL